MIGAVRQQRAGVLLYLVPSGQLNFVDRIAHLEDGVNRTLNLSGDIPRDVHDGPQVLAVNALIDRILPNAGDLAERNQLARGSRQLEILEILDARAIGL